MVRMILGSVVAAFAMLIVGFIFFGPLGLSAIATGSVDDGQAAAIQQTLAASLPQTGTYHVPSAEASAAQTVMYGQGPVATIHYHVGGFAASDPTVLLIGLLFNFVVALLIGAALIGIDRRVPDFGSRARVAVFVAIAAAAFTRLGTPVYEPVGWGYFVYLFIADALALAAAGMILAWFLPESRSAAPGDAPSEV